MELRHFRYFVAVAEELHFARAAARLNIAAPTLSHQIRSLESILGARLFTRKTKTAVVLTPAGKRFLDEARMTLQQADHAARVVRRVARGEVGSLAIGYLFSANCSGLLSSAIRDFRIAHPEVQFQLRKLEPYTIYAAMAEGAIDVAFTCAADRYPSGLIAVTIERTPLLLALSEKHRLATRKQISVDALGNDEFVSTSTELSLWGKTAKTISPRIVARADDICSLLALVSAGLGMGIVPAVLARLAIPGIVFRKLIGVPQRAELVLLYRRNEDAPVAKAFIQQVRMRARDI
jgi:DNA-binding transcriptional LysR family regulator